MWAQDVTAMVGYHGGVSAAAAQLTPWAQAAQALPAQAISAVSNIGTANLGFGNIGNANLGNSNFGSGNIGDANVGSANVGSRNILFGNLGNNNQGIANLGDFNIGIANKGNVAETFAVNVVDRASGLTIASFTVSALAPAASKTTQVSWTPPASATTGAHTLTAYIPTLTGETNTADNTYSLQVAVQ